MGCSVQNITPQHHTSLDCGPAVALVAHARMNGMSLRRVVGPDAYRAFRTQMSRVLAAGQYGHSRISLAQQWTRFVNTAAYCWLNAGLHCILNSVEVQRALRLWHPPTGFAHRLALLAAQYEQHGSVLRPMDDLAPLSHMEEDGEEMCTQVAAQSVRG